MPSGNLPILTWTVAAAGALAANRFVTQAGAYPAAAAKAYGVTRTVAATGDLVPVDVLGTTIVECGGAITKDAGLEVDAQGRVVTLSAGKAVGRAMEDGVSGGFIEVLLLPSA